MSWFTTIIPAILIVGTLYPIGYGTWQVTVANDIAETEDITQSLKTIAVNVQRFNSIGVKLTYTTCANIGIECPDENSLSSSDFRGHCVKTTERCKYYNCRSSTFLTLNTCRRVCGRNHCSRNKDDGYRNYFAEECEYQNLQFTAVVIGDFDESDGDSENSGSSGENDGGGDESFDLSFSLCNKRPHSRIANDSHVTVYMNTRTQNLSLNPPEESYPKYVLGWSLIGLGLLSFVILIIYSIMQCTCVADLRTLIRKEEMKFNRYNYGKNWRESDEYKAIFEENKFLRFCL